MFRVFYFIFFSFFIIFISSTVRASALIKDGVYSASHLNQKGHRWSILFSVDRGKIIDATVKMDYPKGSFPKSLPIKLVNLDSASGVFSGYVDAPDRSSSRKITGSIPRLKLSGGGPAGVATWTLTHAPLPPKAQIPPITYGGVREKTPPAPAVLQPTPPLQKAFGEMPQADREGAQRRLAARDLYSFGIDGLYGPGTRRALEAYARSLSISTAKNLVEARQVLALLLAERVLAAPVAAPEIVTAVAAPTPAVPVAEAIPPARDVATAPLPQAPEKVTEGGVTANVLTQALDVPRMSRDPDQTEVPAPPLDTLYDIKGDDMVLIVNLGPSSPNAYRNLSGDVAFRSNQAQLCILDTHGVDLTFTHFVRARLSEAIPGVQLSSTDGCARGLGAEDGVMLTGDELARPDRQTLRAELVAGIEVGKYVRQITIRRVSFNEDRTKRRALSERYREEVLSGTREGFGAVAFDNRSNEACIVVTQRREAHDAALRRLDEVWALQSGRRVDAFKDFLAEAAFIEAQKDGCRLIYGSSDLLAQLIAASQSSWLAVTVMPTWTSNDEIDGQGAEIDQFNTFATQEERRRQEEEWQRREKEKVAAADRRQQFDVRQQELRRMNGAKVASLVSSIDGQVRAALLQRNASEASSAAATAITFLAPLPAWYRSRLLSGWELDSIVPAPVDYGNAQWRGREVEAVLARIRVFMKNQALGEYSDDCWIVGHVRDTEFSINRAPIVTPCAETAAVSEWKKSLGFVSKWDLGVSGSPSGAFVR